MLCLDEKGAETTLPVLKEDFGGRFRFDQTHFGCFCQANKWTSVGEEVTVPACLSTDPGLEECHRQRIPWKIDNGMENLALFRHALLHCLANKNDTPRTVQNQDVRT